MAQAQRVFDLLVGYEQDISLVEKKVLYRVLDECSHNPLTFIVFSCLATARGKEELILDFFRTMFFNGGSKPLSAEGRRAIRLMQDIADETGMEPKVIPVLVDTEPRRTWGWQVPQEELTGECELMIEEADERGILPKNWEPALWSQIESRYQGGTTSDGTLDIVRSRGKHQLLIAQQERHLRGFSGEYYFPVGLHEAAIRQVAGYALEGVVLEDVFPGAILLQSEWPWREKDPLYQWLRILRGKKPLAIIHPFPR